ncbi:MAG: hypothetical protein KatS3mg090_0957 [Patescibacteria group bacterium]|nr:MAG: hypothetical protein KatS3mg090_0957 [Patescibacteria group bacterium]
MIIDVVIGIYIFRLGLSIIISPGRGKILKCSSKDKINPIITSNRPIDIKTFPIFVCNN